MVKYIMARPLRIQYPDAFYHVTCRGTERRKIFLDDDDRNRFLELLAETLQSYQVTLHGYVLMSNHFHLVVQTARANLSEFMRRFNICYTGWFNKHHSTCGHLYQGRYKAILIDKDNYLLEVSRYVHLNPVRVGEIKKSEYQERWEHVRMYRWSSLPGYVDEERSVDFVYYAMILGMVGGRGKYRRFVEDGLRGGIDDLYEDVHHQVILGDNDFIARVKREKIEDGSMREQPMYRGMIKEVVEPEVVITGVAKALGIEKQRLTLRFGDGVERGIAAELLYRYSDVRQREIGELLGGIDYSAVSVLRRRLRRKIADDRAAGDKYKRAEKYIASLCQE